MQTVEMKEMQRQYNAISTRNHALITLTSFYGTASPSHWNLVLRRQNHNCILTII